MRIPKPLLTICILLILVAASVVWIFGIERGAQVAAKRFGTSVHLAISDKELVAWAENTAAAHSGGAAENTDIPRDARPPELKKLFEDRRYTKAVLRRDRSGEPIAVVFRSGIAGIVIPLNEVIPDAPYYSIHMIEPTCPYYSYSLYK